VDEFVENSALDLLRINANASSNHNYFQLNACNPDPALVGHPAIRAFSFPEIEMKMDRLRDFKWPTAFGVCVRFGWENSPNRIIGRTRWPYLLDEARMLRQKKKGASAVDSQLSAWGFGSGSSGSPLDEAQIKLAGTYREPTWVGASTRFCFFDCAFGGEDPATVFLGEAGQAMFESHDGEAVTKSVVSAIEQQTLPVDQEVIVTQEWLDELAVYLAYTGGGWPESYRITGVHPGDCLSGMFSMAFYAVKYIYENQVPAGNASFDSSQRADCLTTMTSFIGEKNIRWYYEGSRKIQDEEKLAAGWFKWPYEFERKSNGEESITPKLWSSLVTGTISMVWFFSCAFIKKGYLVNGDNCKRGLAELCARPVVKRKGSSEGKRDVLSKDELKKLSQKSPTYAETLALGCYFAVRFLGLVKLDDPARAPVVTVAPGSFQDFIFGSKRFAGSHGAVKRYHPPEQEAPKELSPDALAEMNEVGLKPSQEALNHLFSLQLRG
jgi:hypothetical protein